MTPNKAFVISIDMEPGENSAKCEPRQFSAAFRRLLEIVTQHRLPATWAFSNPSKSPRTEEILAAGPNHEIAISGDRSWAGQTSGRTRFSRELTRRVTQARESGFPATTLVLTDTAINHHFDLLVRQQITMVRPSNTSEREGRSPRQSDSLCYGVWQLPASARFPGVRQWLPGGGAVAVRQTLKRAIAANATTHLAIDATRLSQLGNGALYGLNWILGHVARQQQRGALAVRTLAQKAADLSPQERRTPSRSILRKFVG